jgi:hypothetical protein
MPTIAALLFAVAVRPAAPRASVTQIPNHNVDVMQKSGASADDRAMVWAPKSGALGAP